MLPCISKVSLELILGTPGELSQLLNLILHIGDLVQDFILDLLVAVPQVHNIRLLRSQVVYNRLRPLLLTVLDSLSGDLVDILHIII